MFFKVGPSPPGLGLLLPKRIVENEAQNIDLEWFEKSTSSEVAFT
jgi:hypothetical protein